MLQTFQNKVLRRIDNAPWYEYIRNNDLHSDPHINMVTDKIKKNATKHNRRLQDHENIEMKIVRDVAQDLRRLKSTKPYELA